MLVHLGMIAARPVAVIPMLLVTIVSRLEAAMALVLFLTVTRLVTVSAALAHVRVPVVLVFGVILPRLRHVTAWVGSRLEPAVTA